MERGQNPPSDHWSQHARQWSYVGRPLRPGPEDAALVRAAIAAWSEREGRGDASGIVLGVTPELCGAPVGAGGRIVAVDNSVDMIRRIWPGRVRARDAVICGDWTRMPFETSSADFAFADGALSVLAYPDGYSTLCAELGRVLRPGGRFVVRCFAQAERREQLDEVFEALDRDRIGNFHVLKWRIAMALQESAEAGVAVGSVWSTLDGAWPDLDRLATRTGWPIEEVRTIGVYRGVPTRYTFPTLAEYRELFAAAGFVVSAVAVPSYELGERCPTLVLERGDGVSR